MEKEYEIAYVENPDEAWGIIGRGINDTITSRQGIRTRESYASFFKAQTRK
jgi:hypothetical protein